MPCGRFPGAAYALARETRVKATCPCIAHFPGEGEATIGGWWSNEFVSRATKKQTNKTNVYAKGYLENTKNAITDEN